MAQFAAIAALVLGIPAKPLAFGAFGLGVIALGDYVRRAIAIGRERLRKNQNPPEPT